MKFSTIISVLLTATTASAKLGGTERTLEQRTLEQLGRKLQSDYPSCGTPCTGGVQLLEDVCRNPDNGVCYDVPENWPTEDGCHAGTARCYNNWGFLTACSSGVVDMDGNDVDVSGYDQVIACLHGNYVNGDFSCYVDEDPTDVPDSCPAGTFAAILDSP